MKRRNFFGATALLGCAAGCGTENSQQPHLQLSVDGNGTLAGKTLEELRDEYKYWLFDDYLPFLDRYVIDHEYGGFMCTTDRDGTNINTNKRTWYEGRGIWVYSFLYNEVKSDPQYLDIARKSVEFILKQNPMGKELMPVGYTREGKPLQNKPDPIFYGDMFVANGLQEYSKAVKDEQYWDMAKKIVLKCMDIYDNRPDYSNLAATEDAPEVKQPRMIGHWFVLLRCTTQMLEKKQDSELEEINNRCIDAIINHHHNPEFDLITEYTNHDLSRIDNDYGQVVTGHSPETLWMVLFEAARRKDKLLFDKAARYLERHIEVLWDDVYGGLLGGLSHVDKNIWRTGKNLWLQEEILIGTMFIIEHTGVQWAKDWFSKMYTYVLDKFSLKQYGYPLWILYADRKVTFEQKTSRVGNFHHPRHLMFNLLSLERIIERGGKVSDHFA